MKRQLLFAVLISIFAITVAAQHDAWYVAPMHHEDVNQCASAWRRIHAEDKRFTREEKQHLNEVWKNWCKEHNGAEVVDACKSGYERKTQYACYGFGAAEIPTSREICVLKGAPKKDIPCGVDQ